MENKREKESEKSFFSWYIWGMLWGIVFGTAWHNIGLGIIAGVAVAFGIRLLKQRKNEN